MSGWSHMVCVLASSTALSVMAQVILDMRLIDPKAQALAWVKYVVAFSSSSVESWVAGGTKMSSATKWAMVRIGLIDSLAYGLACYGFSRGGVAWQSIIFSACRPACSVLLTRYWLRKKITRQKSQAVAIVVCGLVISAAPKLWRNNTIAFNLLLGAACAFLAALLYSLIGVMYEGLGKEQPPHREAVRMVSMMGILSISTYQLVYTVPYWQHLIATPFKASGASVWEAIGVHLLFGVVFWIHMHFQTRTLHHHGGLGMTMATAFKGPVMVIVGALFLCSPAKAHSCASLWSALGSLVVAAGIFHWASASRKSDSQLKLSNDKKRR